jgi:transcriptional regulator with XRE-family HTH domain
MPEDEFVRVRSYIAANVRRLRARAGLTQEQLAEAASVDLTYLQRIERGTANPSARVLVEVASALAVPPARLFAKAAPAVRRSGRPRRKA